MVLVLGKGMSNAVLFVVVDYSKHIDCSHVSSDQGEGVQFGVSPDSLGTGAGLLPSFPRKNYWMAVSRGQCQKGSRIH